MDQPDQNLSPEQESSGPTSKSFNQVSSPPAPSAPNPSLSHGGQQTNTDKTTVQDTQRQSSAVSSGASQGLFSGGWRSGCTIFAIVTMAVFLVNLTFTLWAFFKYGYKPGDRMGTLFMGDCKKTARLNRVAHLIINALSTLLLSASNYTMQCLCAPTREDVNRAHRRKKWLDIGVPSVRNLRRVGRVRPIIWCLLGISSVPLHFVYNSAIISTITTYDYNTFITAEGNINPNTTNFERLDKAGCIKKYGMQYLSTGKDVAIVVSGNKTTYPYKTLSGELEPYSWICSTYPEPNYDFCDPKRALQFTDSWKIDGADVKYCLSQRVHEKCILEYSLPIMIAVLICNAVKSICILLAVIWSKGKDDPLVTIGDAILSFLNHPDKTTECMCIVSNYHIRNGIWNYIPVIGETQRSWKPHRVRWFHAASYYRWILCYFLSILALGIGICVYTWALIELGRNYTYRLKMSFLWGLGFGTVDRRTLGVSWFFSRMDPFYSSVISANLPQVVLSFLCLLYNSLYTSMLLGKEWDGFSGRGRPLRVSRVTDEQRPASKQHRNEFFQTFVNFIRQLKPARPKNKQGSSYFLQLPYRYSLPLMLASGLLHWLISQSIFVVREISVGSNDSWLGAKPADRGEPYVQCGVGWSPIPVFFAIIGSVLMLVFAIITGQRKYRGEVPFVGSCSAAISAACHTSSDVKGCKGNVRWGAVWVNHDGIRHCSFGKEEEVTPPESGQVYTSRSR